MASKETVLITGCSDGGIGSALATVFQKRGLHVFATARDPSKMSSLKGLPDVTLLKLDVVKSDDIKAAVEAVTKHTGGTLNYLVSNAGRNHFMPILDEDLDKVRDLFEINFYGPIALTQAFAPLLIKAKGMVAYVTSISGYINVPYMGTYAATKRSLELVAETLRLEIAPFGVGVIEIITGAVKTLGQTYFGDLKLLKGFLLRLLTNQIKLNKALYLN
ncbi:NAD(P)-binding protein [Hypoxylon sp. EC38]|nr:NAD(P)-binding protein [Hypoxylon sp. EC38]